MNNPFEKRQASLCGLLNYHVLHMNITPIYIEGKQETLNLHVNVKVYLLPLGAILPTHAKCQEKCL